MADLPEYAERLLSQRFGDPTPVEMIKKRGRSRSRRRRTLISTGTLSVVAVVAAVAVTGGSMGSGRPSQKVDVGGLAPTTTAIGPSTVTTPPTTGTRPSIVGAVAPCSASRLSARQTYLAEGTGSYYTKWEITDLQPQSCSISGGTPTLALLNAAGSKVDRFVLVRSGPAGHVKSLVLSPDTPAWFVVDFSGPSCTSRQTLGGGPFSYTVALPQSGITLKVSPSELASRSLSRFCPTERVFIEPLQYSKPTPENP